MKKSILIIGLTLFCQLVLSAQELKISETAQKYIDRAEMAMELVKQPSDWQKVIDELNYAVTADSNLSKIIPNIIYNLGISYHAMGKLDVKNYKKAIEYYKQFLTSNPSEEDKEDVINRIKNANAEIVIEKERKELSYQLEMKEQKLEITETAKMYVESARKAMLLVNTPRDYQKVINELRKALTEAPNNPSIIFNLGMCYDGMGVLDVNNYKTAIQYYRQFLALNPSEEDRRNVNRRINKAEYAIEEAAIPEGVLINGVMWATRNVSTPGTFVANPEDYGGIYMWIDAVNACPAGWRLPTNEEFDLLIDAGSAWISVNGVMGRVFGSGKNSVFFPAAGQNEKGENRPTAGEDGYYWSSKSYYNSKGQHCAYSLWIDDEGRVLIHSWFFAQPAKGLVAFRKSCRCVRK